MNPSQAELSQKDFAALRGVSEPMVVKWKRKGRLVMTDDGKRVRVAESISLLESTRDPGRGGDRTGKVSGAPQSVDASSQIRSYQEAATRDKDLSADQRLMDLAAAGGVLTRTDRVEQRIADHVRASIDYLASSRRRIAPTLALEPDARKVEQMLEERDREFCTKLAAIAVSAPPEQEEAA